MHFKHQTSLNGIVPDKMLGAWSHLVALLVMLALEDAQDARAWQCKTLQLAVQRLA